MYFIGVNFKLSICSGIPNINCKFVIWARYTFPTAQFVSSYCIKRTSFFIILRSMYLHVSTLGEIISFKILLNLFKHNNTRTWNVLHISGAQ